MKVLEIGGGENPTYHPNLDIRAANGVDIVHDLEKMPLPIESDSYDMIYSRFALEHISWRQIAVFIKELYRITAPKGKLVIITPNLRAQINILAGVKDINLETWVCMLYGDQNYGENSHKCNFTPELAEKLCTDAGFKNFWWTPLAEWAGDMMWCAEK